VKPEIAIPASYVSPIAAKTAFLKNTLEDTMRSVLKVVRVVATLAALGVLMVFMMSCGSSQTQVRFVQAIWDTSTGAGLDIYFNNTRYFDDLQFLGHGPGSGYTAVPSGSDTIEGYPTGQTSNPSFENEDQSLSSGTEYTLVATGNIINVNNQGGGRQYRTGRWHGEFSSDRRFARRTGDDLCVPRPEPGGG
jgi:hypothetical protein